jgi:hypothetical protein
MASSNGHDIALAPNRHADCVAQRGQHRLVSAANDPSGASSSLPDVRRRYCSKDVRLAGQRGRGFRAAIGRIGQPGSRSDSKRFKGGKERDEAQRSDAEREETQNFFHIGSYAFSISH